MAFMHLHVCDENRRLSFYEKSCVLPSARSVCGSRENRVLFFFPVQHALLTSFSEILPRKHREGCVHGFRIQSFFLNIFAVRRRPGRKTDKKKKGKKRYEKKTWRHTFYPPQRRSFWFMSTPLQPYPFLRYPTTLRTGRGQFYPLERTLRPTPPARLATDAH